MAMSHGGREITCPEVSGEPPPADPGPHSRDDESNPEREKKQGAEHDHTGRENDHL